MNRLFEIDVLRTICIILLLLDHSFAIFSGAWPTPDKIDFIPTYYWLGKFFYSFMLPLWVFISGYLWGLQIIGKQKIPNFKSLLLNKIRRLLLPCYLFGGLYLIVTGRISSIFSLMGCFSYLSGVLHLWFLPMLFWIFILSFMLLKLKIRGKYLFFILLFVSLLSWHVMSLGILTATYYLFYFYMGFLCFKRKKSICKYNSTKNILCLASLFLIAFVLSSSLEPLVSSAGLPISFKRAQTEFLSNLVRFPREFLGVILSYLLILKYINRIKKYMPIISFLAKRSFGIYLFHQFILMYMYYQFPYISLINIWILPFLAFFVTLLISLFAIFIFSKTRIGRQILL